MADMKAYSLIGVLYDSVLYPVSTCSTAPGITEMLNGGNASVSPTIGALMSQKPIVTFGTPALATALAKFGLAFAIESVKTVSLYFGQRTTGGTFLTGSTVVILTINEGAIFLKTVAAQQDQEAIATFDIYATYDGTNLPLVYSLLTAPTDAVLAEKFTLGPFKYSTLLEVQSVNIDMGYDIMHAANSGSPYPTIAAIRRYDPTVTIGTFDMTLVNTVTTIGKLILEAVVYFQKFSTSVGRVPTATAEHVSFTIDDAWAFPGSISSDWRADADFQITLRPIYDGTNAVFQLSTATAIT